MVRTGSTVLIVNSTPSVAARRTGKILSVNPFLIEGLNADQPLGLQAGERVSLIYSSPDLQLHSPSTIVDAKSGPDGWLAELQPIDWTELERRRAIRYPASLEGDISVVLEAGSAPQIISAPLKIENISETGCFLTAQVPLIRGDLVSIALTDPLTSGCHKLFGIVARAVEPNGYGVEFFDYSQNSHAWLADLVESIKTHSSRGVA